MSSSATKSPRARRERNPEETRRRILGAAETEFARKGYDGARLRDVALAAGVHHALLHHYYGDKQGLFRVVVERAFAAASDKAYEALRSTSDVRELTERYVETLVDFFADNPNLVQILHFASLDEGSPAYAACEEIGQNLVRPLLEATAVTVEAAQKAGAIRDDIGPRRLVALSMGAAAYVFQEASFFTTFLGDDVRTPAALAEHKQATLRFLVRSIVAPEGSSAGPPPDRV